MPTKKPLSFEGVHHFLKTLFADDLHAKRVLSLAGATLGVIESASLAVAMIGQGLALARGRLTKHAIKQVDRLLSNPGIDVNALLVHWVPYVVGSRSSITVAMDWTDFDADGQATIMLSLLCRHGRATPLVWLTVDTATLKDQRNAYEDQVLVRLASVLPADVRVRIVADRGFGDQKLYRMLTDELKFDFVIRFRGNIKVTAADGEARPAAEWVGAGGRARVLRGATVTAAGYPVATVVCVQAKDMKQPWCLATSVTNETAKALINLYGKRWGIDIDQSLCLSRDKGWVVWTGSAAFRVKPDCRGNPIVAERRVSTPFECTSEVPACAPIAGNSSRDALQLGIARDGGRCARLSGRLLSRDRRRQAPPGRRSCPDRLQLGDRGGIGGHQLGKAVAGRNRAAT